jgi:hypothetical protein
VHVNINIYVKFLKCFAMKFYVVDVMVMALLYGRMLDTLCGMMQQNS